MDKINFDHINSSPIHSEIINDSDKVMDSYFSNPNQFHSFGRASKVKIEKSRSYIAQQLNIEPVELFFLNDTVSQTKLLINYCVLILNIQYFITSAFEDESVLDYLKVLEQSKKISLSFVPENSIGEVKLIELNRLIDKNNQYFLSLSHVNKYNGLLLPVKEMAKICKEKNALFHLNLKSTIGRYHIDIQKLRPDFATFDFADQNGIKNVGALYLNQSINIKDHSFKNLKSALKQGENIDILAITSLSKSLFLSIKNRNEDHFRINTLREFFIIEFSKELGLEHILANYPKNDLYCILCYFFPSEQFGRYLAEKLDMAGILTSKINHPKIINSEEGDYIRFTIAAKNTKAEIKQLIKILKKHIE